MVFAEMYRNLIESLAIRRSVLREIRENDDRMRLQESELSLQQTETVSAPSKKK